MFRATIILLYNGIFQKNNCALKHRSESKCDTFIQNETLRINENKKKIKIKNRRNRRNENKSVKKHTRTHICTHAHDQSV